MTYPLLIIGPVPYEHWMRFVMNKMYTPENQNNKFSYVLENKAPPEGGENKAAVNAANFPLKKSPVLAKALAGLEEIFDDELELEYFEIEKQRIEDKIKDLRKKHDN